MTGRERRPSWMMEILCPQREQGLWGLVGLAPAGMVIGPSVVRSLAVTAPSSCLMVTAWIGLLAPTGTTGPPLPPVPTLLLLHHTWICASTTAPTPISPSHLQTWSGTDRVVLHIIYTAPVQRRPPPVISTHTRLQTSTLTTTTTYITTPCPPQVASTVGKMTTVPTTTLLHLTATIIHITPNLPPAPPTMT